jgi:uncharacterized protein
MGPLLTSDVQESLQAAARAGLQSVQCSLDLKRSVTKVEPEQDAWVWHRQRYPYVESCRERTIYHWTGASFEPAKRFTGSLIKLVPTDWGPPTFEIDGIKMLPTAQVSPYADAEHKVSLIKPRGKVVLDTCGGLGYFAAWCVAGGVAQVLSFEKNPDVIWLRGLNPWSPLASSQLTLTQADITVAIARIADASVDAVLHDPPRFGIAGELYSQAFYDQLARVIKPQGSLFHYTGMPNKLTTGRDVPNEVAFRLQRAGFSTQLSGDGVLAKRQRRGTSGNAFDRVQGRGQ